MQIGEHNVITQVFQFSKLSFSKNKVVNKKLNIINVDEKTNTIQCKDTQNEPTVTRAEHPFSLQHCVAYFQAEIKRTTQEDLINIGLMSKDCNNKMFIGKSNNSFGYLKGDLYLDKKKVSTPIIHEKLKQGDRIGIGINCHKRTLFFVKNQLLVQQNIQIPNSWNDFYPAVALSNQSQKVQFHFEQFRFKLDDFCKKIQQQLQKQIQESNYFTNSQIYSLVHQYLSFNNYSQTLSLLKEKKIEYHKLSKYTKNPSAVPTINLQKKMLEGMDEEMNEPLKIRNRIMSERLNDNQEEILDMRRKNTEMVVEELHVPRKCSLISNISNISNVLNIGFSSLNEEKSQFKEEDEVIVQVLNENQQFLENQRRKIIEYIRNRKIEEAIVLMQQTIPQIFQQKYLMSFMKAHIFLKKVKEESNKEAINYSKKQRESLRDNYGILCPFYSSVGNKVEWKPLNTVFLAMTYNTQTQCKLSQKCSDLLSDEQFNVFANYVNRLILKKMGYLSCSRLTYFANHMKKIQQKLKEFKGMSCGIELNI